LGVKNVTISLDEKTAAFFIDTNVFVYARDAGERVKQAAAEQWIRRLWIEQRGRTSVIAEAPASYAVPKPISRHRSRGRPARRKAQASA
jgi:predicted nucleic acid-binding protein